MGSRCPAQGAEQRAPAGWGGGGREDQEGGGICIHTAASHCCTVETNTTLESSYALIFFLKDQ